MKLKNDAEKAFDKALSIILKARRNEVNISQEYLSIHSGVSRITIGKWERGEKTPISYDLYNVLKVLYKDPSEFWKNLHVECEKVLPGIMAAADKMKVMDYFNTPQKKKKK